MRTRLLCSSLLIALSISQNCFADPAAAEKSIDEQMESCPGMTEWQAEMRAKKAALKIEEQPPTQPALREKLLAMMVSDQSAREAMMGGHKSTPEELKQLWKIDAENLPRIKAILKKHGFPSAKQVGKDGANAAFLLVQHADNDPAFQTRALKLMQPLLARHEINAADVALLTDRVLVAQKQPQRYGSQFDGINGVNVLHALEDPAHLDARRASMDLFPMRTYACIMTTAYRLPLDLSALDASPAGH